MIKSKNKVVSLILVAAMVLTMLPLGALTAFAASTAAPSSPTSKVITGTSGTTVTGQAADSITIKEDSENHGARSAGDTPVKLQPADGNVLFTSKPTVTHNGTALPSSQVTFPASRAYIKFTISGTSDQDKIVVSNIKYDLGPVTAENISVNITGLTGGALTAKNAKVQNGLVFSAPTSVPTLDADKDNQPTGGLRMTLTESTDSVVAKDDYITITAPAGVTFYESPVATVTASTMTLYNKNAVLNEGCTEAKWQVSGTSSDCTSAVIGITAKVNVAASVAADADVNFTGGTSSSDYTVAPASVKVAKISAADALTFSASAAPDISNSANQAAATITITESKAGALEALDSSLTVELVSGTFASNPIATPSGAGLTLKNASGDAVTTGLPAT